MVARVQEHVAERVPHFARRPEETHVVAIGKDAAGVLSHSVDGKGKPRADCLHAATDGFAILRFDDQVSVVALQ